MLNKSMNVHVHKTHTLALLLGHEWFTVYAWMVDCSYALPAAARGVASVFQVLLYDAPASMRTLSTAHQNCNFVVKELVGSFAKPKLWDRRSKVMSRESAAKACNFLVELSVSLFVISAVAWYTNCTWCDVSALSARF